MVFEGTITRVYERIYHVSSKYEKKRNMRIRNPFEEFFCLCTNLRACLYRGGGPQIGEVTCGRSPHLSCKPDQIKMIDYMDRWVTPPKRVTSPTWGPPPQCKQALSNDNIISA